MENSEGSQMTASIMMVTYNRLELTKQTLEDLFKTTDYPFNLIIVDNGSNDGTVDYLTDTLLNNKSEHLKEYNIIQNKENLGIATGRNLALYKAIHQYNAQWLVTIDNDVLVPNGWLSEAIEILQSCPQFAAIGVNMEGVQYPMVTKGGKSFQEKPQGNLGTAAMIFRRSLHEMLGYFNYSDYNKFYGLEDSDFGMRIRVVGFKLGYIKENGKHLGEGNNDTGAYREFKTKSHDSNIAKFNANCRAYYNRTKSLYIGFDGSI